MYRVTGYFKNTKIVQTFYNLYDAIEFKDIIDANYPNKVTFEKGIFPMRTHIINSWNVITHSDTFQTYRHVTLLCNS